MKPLEKPGFVTGNQSVGICFGLFVIGTAITIFLVGLDAVFFDIVCCPIGIGFLTMVIGVLPVSAIVGAITGESDKQQKEFDTRQAPNPESLNYKESIINQRISELPGRENKLNEVLQKADKISGKEWDRVSDTLEETIKTLRKQQARYQSQLIEIAAVRILNQAAPVIDEIDDYSYEDLDKHSVKMVELLAGIKELAAKLNQQKVVLGKPPETNRVIAYLNESGASLIKLHDALIGRQAVLALKEIKPINEAMDIVSLSIADIKKSDVFNIQVAITDFSDSFKELEAEYTRLQTEEAVAGKSVI